MKKYSFKTCGYYDDAIHGTNIPSDAVSITEDEYKSLLSGQASGKIVIKSQDGRPALSDGLPPTSEHLASVARMNRDELLRKSDFSQLPDAPGNKSAWAIYRQALRDIPDKVGFPSSVIWPEKPKN